MELFWAAITVLGDLRFWILAIFLIGVYLAVERPKLSRHTKRALLTLLIALIAVALATQAVKMAVNAPRICTPCCTESQCMTIGCNPYCPMDDPYGFPSGHSAMAFGAFTAIWLAFPRNNKERAKFLWILILPILVCFSRVALDVHTPLEVAAGAAIGVAVAVAVWLIRKRR